MSRIVGANKPPAFYLGKVEEHLRMIVDYLTTGPVARDGSEQTEMVRYSHLDQAMTADVDDLDIAGHSVVRFSLDAAWVLGGIEGLPGQWLLIINASSAANSLTLEDEATSGSVAENRFKIPGGQVVAQNETVLLWYDGVDSRWRQVTPL